MIKRVKNSILLGLDCLLDVLIRVPGPDGGRDAGREGVVTDVGHHVRE